MQTKDDKEKQSKEIELQLLLDKTPTSNPPSPLKKEGLVPKGHGSLDFKRFIGTPLNSSSSSSSSSSSTSGVAGSETELSNLNGAINVPSSSNSTIEAQKFLAAQAELEVILKDKKNKTNGGFLKFRFSNETASKTFKKASTLEIAEKQLGTLINVHDFDQFHDHAQVKKCRAKLQQFVFDLCLGKLGTLSKDTHLKLNDYYCRHFGPSISSEQGYQGFIDMILMIYNASIKESIVTQQNKIVKFVEENINKLNLIDLNFVELFFNHHRTIARLFDEPPILISGPSDKQKIDPITVIISAINKTQKALTEKRTGTFVLDEIKPKCHLKEEFRNCSSPFLPEERALKLKNFRAIPAGDKDGKKRVYSAYDSDTELVSFLKKVQDMELSDEANSLKITKDKACPKLSYFECSAVLYKHIEQEERQSCDNHAVSMSFAGHGKKIAPAQLQACLDHISPLEYDESTNIIKLTASIWYLNSITNYLNSLGKTDQFDLPPEGYSQGQYPLNPSRIQSNYFDKSYLESAERTIFLSPRTFEHLQQNFKLPGGEAICDKLVEQGVKSDLVPLISSDEFVYTQSV